MRVEIGSSAARNICKIPKAVPKAAFWARFLKAAFGTAFGICFCEKVS